MIRSVVLVSLVLFALSVRAETPGAAPSLESSPSRYVTAGGLKIHYKVMGSGSPVLVFVHGWTCDLTFFREQAPLASKARLVFIDLPGHGKSDKPKTEYTMEFMARAVDAVLEDLDIKDAVLVGHSMGTAVIRQYYRLFPAKVLALVAADGALRPFFKDVEARNRYVSLFSAENYKDVIGKAADGMFAPGAPEALKASVKAVMQSAPQHVVVSAARGMTDPAIFAESPVSVPLLCLYARNPMWGAEYEEYVRKLGPKVDFIYLDGAGHFLMLEKPAQFNAELTGYLQKQELLK